MALLFGIGRICYRTVLRLRRLTPVLILLCFVFGFAVCLYIMTAKNHRNVNLSKLIMNGIHRKFPRSNHSGGGMLIQAEHSAEKKQLQNINQGLTVQAISTLKELPHYDVHIFYYAWYGNPAIDGDFLHWNHKLLSHWNAKEAVKWPSGRHNPPEDVGANYYPSLGAYSSRNRTVIDNHMQQIRRAGIGVLSLSWYPPGMADDNGQPWDDLVPILLNSANKYQLKLCFHIEPYKNRDVSNFKENIIYIIKRYGDHAAFYRRQHKTKYLPVFYVYDSYLTSSAEWKSLFQPGGEFSIRGTEYDGVFLGLLTEQKSKADILQAGFDGFYTYFASNGFTDGSTTKLWPMLKEFANKNNLLFVPSVGPGYIDTRVRPWNGRNTKDRQNGGYYEQMFGAALNAKAPIVSITSFNEWHEGSQVERAQPKALKSYNYLNYGSNGPDFYLKLTRKWVDKYRKLIRTN